MLSPIVTFIIYNLSTVISRRLPAREIPRTGHFLQQQEKNFNRLPALADNTHPKTKEIRELTKLSARSISLTPFNTGHFGSKLVVATLIVKN